MVQLDSVYKLYSFKQICLFEVDGKTMLHYCVGEKQIRNGDIIQSFTT